METKKLAKNDGAKFSGIKREEGETSAATSLSISAENSVCSVISLSLRSRRAGDARRLFTVSRMH